MEQITTMAEVMIKPYQNQNNELTHHIKNFFNQRHLFKFVTPTPETFDTASQLAAKHKIKLIDALHCAIALQSGCKVLITNDMGIPSLDSLEIILLKNLIAS